VGTANVYGKWSKDLFADAAIVDSPGRLIFVAGMAAEDPADGHIHHRGDCAAQTRMAYDKIKAILAAQGADLSHVVRIVAYLTDMRDKNAYESEQRLKQQLQRAVAAYPAQHPQRLALQGPELPKLTGGAKY